MIGFALVPERNVATNVEQLGMSCDAREIPVSGDDKNDPAPRFIGVASVNGTFLDVLTMTEEAISTAATFAVAVLEARIFIILAPLNNQEPAVWCAAERDAPEIVVEVAERDRRGRVTAVRLHLGALVVEMNDIQRLLRTMAQPRQGSVLLQELERPRRAREASHTSRQPLVTDGVPTERHSHAPDLLMRPPAWPAPTSSTTVAALAGTTHQATPRLRQRTVVAIVVVIVVTIAAAAVAMQFHRRSLDPDRVEGIALANMPIVSSTVPVSFQGRNLPCPMGGETLIDVSSISGGVLRMYVDTHREHRIQFDSGWYANGSYRAFAVSATTDVEYNIAVPEGAQLLLVRTLPTPLTEPGAFCVIRNMRVVDQGPTGASAVVPGSSPSSSSAPTAAVIGSTTSAAAVVSTTKPPAADSSAGQVSVSVPSFTDRTWAGTLYQGPQSFEFTLTLASDTGTTSGQEVFASLSCTLVTTGLIVTDFGDDAERSRWQTIGDSLDLSNGLWLRWANIAYKSGGGVILEAPRYGHLLPDGTIHASWFYPDGTTYGGAIALVAIG